MHEDSPLRHRAGEAIVPSRRDGFVAPQRYSVVCGRRQVVRGAETPGLRSRQLATTLLLTYALRNADCHAKNLALLYTSRADVHLSPAYDMITSVAYLGYQQNPPGISFMGKKTWSPGKSLGKFIAAAFGVSVKAQVEIVEAISDAVSDIAPRVRESMTRYVAFQDIGKRILLAWNEGVTGLRGKRVYGLQEWNPSSAIEGFFRSVPAFE